jgi:hypothetical protein
VIFVVLRQKVPAEAAARAGGRTLVSRMAVSVTAKSRQLPTNRFSGGRASVSGRASSWRMRANLRATDRKLTSCFCSSDNWTPCRSAQKM